MRNALARFDQVEGVSDEERAQAFASIKKAAEHYDVEVTDAMMGEGLLVISLKRELPEALKPQSIPINAGTFVPLGRKPTSSIEHQADSKRAA